MADETRPAGRTKKFLVGGLVTLAAVAIALALIFTVGGQGPKDKAAAPATSSSTTSSLADAPEVEPVKTVPITPVKTTPVTPVTPVTTTPAAPVTTPVAPVPPVTNLLKDVFSPGKMGDPLQAASSLSVSKQAMDAAMGDGGCWVSTADDLAASVDDSKCSTIMLCADGVFALSDELKITRPITIIGHPRTMPVIDGSGTVRAFHVMNGGYLDMRFVRVKQGGGTMQDRLIFGGTGGIPTIPDGGAGRKMQGPNSKIAVIYGGGILFDAGALGGNLRRVIFEAVANTPASVVNAITSMVNFVGGRVIGGHVTVVAGIVNFIGCVFWDTGILLPFTDQVTIGGDVLIMGGAVNFIGCFFFATLLFGQFMGFGFNVGVFGGTCIMTGVIITSQGLFQSTNGAGQLFGVGGGVLVIAGMDFHYVVAGLFFSGIGDWFVGGGVMVLTGFTIENAYSLLVAVGAGFYTAVGAGILVQAGVTFYQVNGPNFQTLAGASIFLGSGNAYHTGVPSSFYQTTGYYAGIGAYSYSGPGYAQYLAMPLAVFAATWSFYGIGAAWAHMAGYVLFIANPSFTPTGAYYAAGNGGVLWVGRGAATIGASPTFAPVPAGASWVNVFNENFNNFVVNGNSADANGDDLDGIADWWSVRRKLQNTSAVATAQEVEPVDVDKCLADLDAGKFNRRSVVLMYDLKNIEVDDTHIPDWFPKKMADGFKKMHEMRRMVLVRRGLLGQDDTLKAQNGEGSHRNLNNRNHIKVRAAKDPSKSACLVVACDNSEMVDIDVDGPALIEANTCAELKKDLDKIKDAKLVTGEEHVVYDPTIIVPTTVTVDSDKKVSEADVKQALLTSMGPLGLVAEPAVSAVSGASVTKYRKLHIERHLSAADLLTSAAAGAPANPSALQVFDVNFVLRNAADGTALADAVANDATTNTFGGVTKGAKDYLSTVYGASAIKDLSVEAGGPSLTIPAYGTNKFQEFVNRQLNGGLQADVAIKDATGASVQSVQAGDVLTVTVSAFPKETKKVSIQLIGAAASGTAGLKQTVIPVAKDIALDTKGGVKTSFAIPAGTALGEYYVMVFDSGNKANMAMGDTFKVHNKPQVRRQLGPRAMYL